MVSLGDRPVFVDISPVDYNLDAAAVADSVTPRTKAIIPVHLYGQCADMGPILEVARRHGLAVVEDAAQAIGTEGRGPPSRVDGDGWLPLLFPSKNLGGFGDGGALVTNDPELAERCRCLRGHGASPKYFHKVVGGNFRLDTLQAAVLRVKLHRLDEWTAARQRNADAYTAAFTGAGLAGVPVGTPRVIRSRHVFNQYVVRLTDRDAVQRHLKLQKIGSKVYYPQPMHLQECFAYLGHGPGDFPESERAAAATLALPIHPELLPVQRDRIVRVIAEYYRAAHAACVEGRLSPEDAGGCQEPDAK